VPVGRLVQCYWGASGHAGHHWSRASSRVWVAASFGKGLWGHARLAPVPSGPTEHFACGRDGKSFSSTELVDVEIDF
jgi:hypothetical protein